MLTIALQVDTAYVCVLAYIPLHSKVNKSEKKKIAFIEFLFLSVSTQKSKQLFIGNIDSH